MDIPTIHASRLDLRPFRQGDAALLAPMMADPEMVRYFPFKSPPTADQVARHVDGQEGHWNTYGHGWWAVELHDGAEFAGWCGFQYLPESDEIELGYLLAKPHWGNGLATEAAAHALSYAFGPLELDAVVGVVHPDNVGSRRVLEKVGGACPTPDRYFGMDCLRFILTAEAYRKVAPNLGVKELPSPGPGEREPEGLDRRVDSLALDARYGAALEAAATAADHARNRHVALLYKMARMSAFTGHRKQAYAFLDQAIRAGFWDAGRLQEDAAFAHLRRDAAFRPALRAAWANGYILMLEREERDSFQMPDKVMETLAFRPGEKVAEIGPGSGYFTVRVARAVEPEGKVYALDASQEMLDHLRRRIQVECLENVETAGIPRDDPGLPADDVDTVLMVDVLHYVADKPAYAKKLAASLRPGARVIVVDYTPKPIEERPWGPPPEQQVPREEIDADMAAAGFTVETSYDFLPEQYMVVYRLQ